MHFFELLFDPAIALIVLAFVSMVYYCIKNFNYVNKNLLWTIDFLKKYKKSDLLFRFSEFDKTISSNKYLINVWQEFRNTLVFSESVAMKKDNNVAYENISKSVNNIQTTVDPIYFFSEETLVTSKYNSKFVQIAPTLLTGLGPLFTFLNIAIAFTKVDFSTSESTVASVSGLMSSMQVAALCSVLAVGASLIFLLFEKLAYNKKCKQPLLVVQQLFYGLFDSISSEKFLIELLKETKIQNNKISQLISTLPMQLKDSIDKSLATSLIPYLENMIFGINNLKDVVKKKAEARKSGDIIDDLF